MTTASAGATPELSVVIPIFNERDNLEPLLQELEGVLTPLNRPFEVLAVDDCSTDDSLQVLRALQKSRPWLRVIRHRLNSGESAAGVTGFRSARGDLLITIDGDGQNDPADIPALLNALTPDVAAVCGIRRKREDDIVKRLSSRIANRFRNFITGDRIADAGCTYRVIRRAAVQELPVFNGTHRFLPTMLRLQGYRVTELLINHRPRTRGVSKYGVGNRLWRGIADCLAMRWYRARCVSAERVHPDDRPSSRAAAGPS